MCYRHIRLIGTRSAVCVAVTPVAGRTNSERFATRLALFNYTSRLPISPQIPRLHRDGSRSRTLRVGKADRYSKWKLSGDPPRLHTLWLSGLSSEPLLAYSKAIPGPSGCDEALPTPRVVSSLLSHDWRWWLMSPNELTTIIADCEWTLEVSDLENEHLLLPSNWGRTTLMQRLLSTILRH